MKGKKKDCGRIEVITLKKPITLNENTITRAIIEIDHINYGLNKRTGKLNEKKRTNFTVTDIEKFLMMLDGDYIPAKIHKGRISKFDVRIDCPIKGIFFNKEFIMFFDTDYDQPEQIHTITLYPGW